MNWVCYLLRCADDTLYCGITNDLERRLAAHDAGTASKYTRVRLPVELVFAESCRTGLPHRGANGIKNLSRKKLALSMVRFI